MPGPYQLWLPEYLRMVREELADPRFEFRQGRLLNADEVDALMLPWLLDHDKVDIFKAGQDEGLGFSYVASMQDILEMEQLEARDYFITIEHPIAGKLKYPGPPINPQVGDSSNTSLKSAWVYKPAPLLGQHTQELLSELGYSLDEINQIGSAKK